MGCKFANEELKVLFFHSKVITGHGIYVNSRFLYRRVVPGHAISFDIGNYILGIKFKEGGFLKENVVIMIG